VKRGGKLQAEPKPEPADPFGRWRPSLGISPGHLPPEPTGGRCSRGRGLPLPGPGDWRPSGFPGPPRGGEPTDLPFLPITSSCAALGYGPHPGRAALGALGRFDAGRCGGGVPEAHPLAPPRDERPREAPAEVVPRGHWVRARPDEVPLGPEPGGPAQLGSGHRLRGPRGSCTCRRNARPAASRRGATAGGYDLGG
jgi:hypothetical protein